MGNNGENIDNTYEHDDFIEFKKLNLPFKRKSIKNQSLFNQHFIDIAEKIKKEASLTTTGTANLLYNEKYINFLLDFFMPYAGVWAGFVF